jgi:hypothetical protein
MKSYYYYYQGGTSGRRPVVKIIAESLSQHGEKHVVPTPLGGIKVGKEKKNDDRRLSQRAIAVVRTAYDRGS